MSDPHTVPTLAFVDTETTGLDPRIHQPYEVCIWRKGWEKPQTFALPHTLDHADAGALTIGHYWDRERQWKQGDHTTARVIATHLRDVTLVGSNPGFDAAMLTRVIGTPVWRHRMIDVGTVAMVTFGLDLPIGLAEVHSRLVDIGYDIPGPDHTAEGDVRTTRAVYEVLRSIGGA